MTALSIFSLLPYHQQRSYTAGHSMQAKVRRSLLLIVPLQIACSVALAETGNPRVNQIGYLPHGAKTATYRTEDAEPKTWWLRKNGRTIAHGQSSRGIADASSGDHLQQIDFSAAAATGSGFTLQIGTDTSYTFSISPDAFRAPLYDALKYFYHNRSGIAIETQFTGGGNTLFASDSKWARAAGHISRGVNKGDFNVPCWEGTCQYSLDVPKGWYDAGDHGKYVVNAGISVWTLMNMYERGLYWGTTTRFADGTLNIPESSNGIPDVLDEVRWELEFMLAMQVPKGQAKAGMVHHKIHDVAWTGLPLAPDQDPQKRALVPPSTAATLNLAATAAQASRIWKHRDPAFSARCLEAAQSAWRAARANPAEIYRGGYDNGGGAYDDDKVADEFYWAAVELYLSTGDDRYVPTIDAYTITRTDFNWANTELAGLMSLATVVKPFSANRRATAQRQIIAIADTHLHTQSASGYSTPLAVSEYDWGSNGGVANRLMLMGLAYQFSGNVVYADGVTKGVDYLFGRNTFSTSFVTGEGSVAAQYPHHRFWAGVLNPVFPLAPPGALTGGPNAGLQDPVAKNLLGACTARPATCWLDRIEAYSVNEVAINWNAPLAWVLDFQNGMAGLAVKPGL
jgi:endoglucanase